MTMKVLSIGRTLTNATTRSAGAVQKAGIPSSGRIGSSSLPSLQPRVSTPGPMRPFASKPGGNDGQSKTISEEMAVFKSSLKSALPSADQLNNDLANMHPDQFIKKMHERHIVFKEALNAKGIDINALPGYIKAKVNSINELLKPSGIKFDITFSDSLERVTKTITPGFSDVDFSSGGMSRKVEFDRAFLVGKAPTFNILNHEITPVLTVRVIGQQLRIEGGVNESASVAVLPKYDAGILQIEAGVDFKSNSIDKGQDGRAVIGGKYSLLRSVFDNPVTVVGHYRNVSPRTEEGNDIFLEFPTLKQSPRETSKAFLKRVERVAIGIAEVSKNIEIKKSEDSIFQQSENLEDWEFVRTVFTSHIRKAELAEFNDANRRKNKNSIDSTKLITDLEIKKYFNPEP